jgi:hypothetical protein
VQQNGQQGHDPAGRRLLQHQRDVDLRCQQQRRNETQQHDISRESTPIGATGAGICLEQKQCTAQGQGQNRGRPCDAEAEAENRQHGAGQGASPHPAIEQQRCRGNQGRGLERGTGGEHILRLRQRQEIRNQDQAAQGADRQAGGEPAQPAIAAPDIEPQQAKRRGGGDGQRQTIERHREWNDHRHQGRGVCSHR